MSIFPINCPSCQNEITNAKLIIEALSEKLQKDIPENDASVLSKVPTISKEGVIKKMMLPTCCVAEIISAKDRTPDIYGYNYERI